MYYLVFCIFLLASCEASGWSYHGDDGPAHWAVQYPSCGHQKQSPISIKTEAVKPDGHLTGFTFINYDTAPSTMTLLNTGHQVQVILGQNNMELTGGGMYGSFRPTQFHFHWGSNNSQGGEHVINDVKFPMEMHVVHYNKKYGDLDLAIDKADGVAVLSFLFKVVQQNSSDFEKIVKYLPNIKYKDWAVNISTFDIQSLLPTDTNFFYRYQGSLTTPPCYESVPYWTIFPDPVQISNEQLSAFRNLEMYPKDNGHQRKLVNNYRPVQNLNGRTVRAPGFKITSMFIHSGGSHSPGAEVLLTVLLLQAIITVIIFQER